MVKRILIIFLIVFVTFEQNIRIIGAQKSKENAEYRSFARIPPLRDNKNSVSNPINFNHTIPDTFLVNQIFTFVGQVDFMTALLFVAVNFPFANTWEVNIVLIKTLTKEKFIFTKKMDFDDLSFVQHIFFKKPGKYELYIFIGDSGFQSPKVITVIEGNILTKIFSNTIFITKPENLQVKVEQNDLYVSWERKNGLTKVEFSQNDPAISKEFIVSNDIGYLIVPYAEFHNFTQSPTKIQVSHAQSKGISALERTSGFSSVTSLIINVTHHRFQTINNKWSKVSFENPIDSMISLGNMIKFKGISSEKLSDTVLVRISSGYVKQSNLNVNEPLGQEFRFEVEQLALEPGTYIVEIYFANGTQFINTPIYVGNQYPLLPDLMDISLFYDSGKRPKIELDRMRKFVLDDINEIRKNVELPELKMDQKLNRLSQEYAEDMVNREFKGHVNPEGQKVEDRAANMGIIGNILENIGEFRNLETIRYLLSRQLQYLKNSMDETKTKIGIGISMNKQGIYYLVENYQ